MFWFSKKCIYSIGVDMSDDSLRLAQLGDEGKGLRLIAAGSESRPEDVKPGTVNWQRWALDAVKKLTADGNFQGRDVIAATPPNELFVEHLKTPKVKDDKLHDTIVTKIKKKLPFECDGAMIKYIQTDNDNILAMVTEREKIDRHLAIYEQANLQIKSIGAWPAALTNSYVRFFGRRETDIQTIVMLLDIEADCTNVVICRHKNLLFARSIPIGAEHLDDEMLSRLVLELTGCRRHFSSMYRMAQIERLIFLSGRTLDTNISGTIAKQLEMPTQIGDCLAAVEIANPSVSGIDRRECQFSWATAFGLSLS